MRRLVRAAKGGDDGMRGWRRDALGQGTAMGGGGEGGVFPHYKFNLTNGSENLETMEYMKCGRVYHAGGDAGWFRRQYCQGRSIFSESATARGPSGVEGAKVVPGMGERQNMLLARQEAARGSRRTVPVAFGSCCANAGMSSLVSLFPVRRRRFSFKVRLRGFYFEDSSERSGIVEISNMKDNTKSKLSKLLSSLYML